MTRAFVVLNADAGGGRPEGFEELLATYLGSDGYLLYETTDRGAIEGKVREAIEQGCDLVLAAGGDGTLSNVAAGVVGTGIPLAIIPAGTSNSLAQQMGIPMDPNDALELVAGRHTVRPIDGMRANERFCLLNVGVGLSPRIMSDTGPEEKQRFGRLAYVATAAKDILGNRAGRFVVEVDSQTFTIKASEVLVLNSGVLGDPSVRWARGIEIDDGQLDVCVVSVRNALDYARVGLRLLFGRSGSDSRSAVQCFPVKRRVTIRTPSPERVQADGDVIGRTPVSVELIPDAVTILVPVEGDGEELAE